MDSAGTLYIVATPIGNLGDMTARAIETLREVDVVYSEDTRVTRRLFTHFEICTPIKRFDDVTSERKIPEVIDALARGMNIALVSDAGTPVISDPGMPLVAAARERDFDVVAIPGASSVTAALSISGLPAHAYYFGGYLPKKSGRRENLLHSLSGLNATLIFFESPHRIVKVIEHLASLYPQADAAIARELTKRHEELLRGSFEELAAELTARKTSSDSARTATLKGEFVILIAPLSKDIPSKKEKY
jgi:16S rRNA (cytidine1402-2'-O)-methyltransferase